MSIEGWVDIRQPMAIGGWARDSSSNEMLTLEAVLHGEVVGTASNNARRDEFVGRADAAADHSFWVLPSTPLADPSVVKIRIAGTEHYLADKLDRIPLPSDDLIFDVVGGRNITPQFLSAGAANHQFIQKLISETRNPLKEGARVLDWGCGCGRVARHWSQQSEKIELHGCDIHEGAIAWCSDNMPFGEYKVSGLLPPLPYPDNHFDVLYATSVLTHLLFKTHYQWMSEIWRVLKPGGIAILTSQGPSLLPMVAGEIAKHGFRVQTDVIDDGMFIGLDRGEGSNSTGNIVTRDVMERIFSPFALKAYKPSYGLMGIQDTYVFYKNTASTLTLKEELYRSPLSGTEQRIEIDPGVDGFSDVSLLVALPGLTQAATVELLVEFKGSEMLPLSSGSFPVQEKSTWTDLIAAYRFLRVEGIPKHDGNLRLVVICRSELPMDGARLVVDQAMFLR